MSDMVRTFNRDLLKIAILAGDITWRKHVLIRISQRGIRQDDILSVICNGRIIQEYADDTPFPSALFFGMCADRPMHAVAAFDIRANHAYIITAYEPSLEIFEPDYTTRRLSW